MGDKVRIAVLVSGGGTNLRALLEDDNPWGAVVLVVSSRADAGALGIAHEHGVETVVVDGKQADFAGRLIEVLTSHDVELVVLAGYLTILPPEVVAAYPRRIVNVHPALLPSFGGPGFYGLRVHEAALARGVKVTGATVHFVDDVPDHGEIIAQKAVDVLPDDTPETLQRRVMQQAEWVLLPQVVRDLCRGMTQWRQIAERRTLFEQLGRPTLTPSASVIDTDAPARPAMFALGRPNRPNRGPQKEQ